MPVSPAAASCHDRPSHDHDGIPASLAGQTPPADSDSAIRDGGGLLTQPGPESLRRTPGPSAAVTSYGPAGALALQVDCRSLVGNVVELARDAAAGSPPRSNSTLPPVACAWRRPCGVARDADP